MRITKQLTGTILGLSLIGLLAGCGSTASSTAKSSASTASSAASTADAASKTNAIASTTSTTPKQAAPNANASTQQPTTATQTPTNVPGNATDAKTPISESDNTSVAAVLKIDNNTLQKDLRAGQSLADIAIAQGVPEQQVIDALMQKSKKSLDQAVANGQISQTTEQQDLALLQSQMKQQVERRNPAK